MVTLETAIYKTIHNHTQLTKTQDVDNFKLLFVFNICIFNLFIHCLLLWIYIHNHFSQKIWYTKGWIPKMLIFLVWSHKNKQKLMIDATMKSLKNWSIIGYVFLLGKHFLRVHSSSPSKFPVLDIFIEMKFCCFVV